MEAIFLRIKQSGTTPGIPLDIVDSRCSTSVASPFIKGKKSKEVCRAVDFLVARLPKRVKQTYSIMHDREDVLF